MQNFMLALMATLALGFLLAVPPSRWMDIHCDAISLNLVALSAIAGLALVYALTPQRPWPVIARFGIGSRGRSRWACGLRHA